MESINIMGYNWYNHVLEEYKDILVGGFNPSEKYEFVSWDYYSQ